jgi:hypothetical protein
MIRIKAVSGRLAVEMRFQHFATHNPGGGLKRAVAVIGTAHPREMGAEIANARS